MKSMLHEASSILKAIEKAWNESGNPTEFAIKILEKGEKNFLGFSKRPAIVSITYGLNSRDAGSIKQRGREHGRASTSFKKFPAESQSRDYVRENGVASDLARQPKPARVIDRPKWNAQGLQNTVDRTSVRPIKDGQEVAKGTQSGVNLVVWNDEMVGFCAANLREILSLLKMDCSFSTKINDKNLVIYFDKVIESVFSEDLRAFYSGISHLLMQFLKRKQKTSLKGLQIFINIATNERQVQNKSN